MNSNIMTARIAGGLYLIVAICGVFSLMYIPSTLIVWGDAAATAGKITASETLFRAGILSGFTCMIALYCCR